MIILKQSIVLLSLMLIHYLEIDDTINKIAQYNVFSTIDLKSAYHQAPIRDEEKKYTAFEANQRLNQFRRVPFGVTNGAAAFQKIYGQFHLRRVF